MNKNKSENKMKIPFRLNIFFFIVFIMFAVLVVQLAIVQILEGEAYQKEIDRTIDDITNIPTPRGLIYDRNHKPVVSNNPLYSITYTPPKGMQAKGKLELANKLVDYINLDKEKIDKITEREKKEYWYLLNEEKALELTSDEEKEELEDIELYDLSLERITEEDLKTIKKEEFEVIAIKSELDKAYSLTPHIIKNKDISVEEYAKIAENLNELPGINATTDWERDYLYKDTFKKFIGSITTEAKGIPEEKEEYFMSRGYNRNDRVGTSGLEEQYEEYLRGRKEQIQYTTTKKGEIVDSETIVEGERGKDLVLSLDIEFQEKVDEIVLKELKKNVGSSPYLNDALAVVMDPKTGEILALSGQSYDRKNQKYSDIGIKTLHDANIPGSTIKGATVATGFENDIISPGTVFIDKPLKFKGSATKSSVGTLGAVNEQDALRRSSNVYMFYIAMQLGGEYRHPFPDNGKLGSNAASIQKLRNTFNQTGLGVKTGVDFPYEATGVIGTNTVPSDVLDFSIGQYDTYTTLQLAQYVSTIANDGYRVKPHIVKDIHYPSGDKELGSIYKSNETEVLNKMNIEDNEIKRIQEGFRGAFQSSGGTGYGYWSGKKYNPAGKTGTAEYKVFEDGKMVSETENLSLVGYAPYDDPEVAFAVVVPNLAKNRPAITPINHAIGTGIMDAYFEMKEEKDKDKK